MKFYHQKLLIKTNMQFGLKFCMNMKKKKEVREVEGVMATKLLVWRTKKHYEMSGPGGFLDFKLHNGTKNTYNN